MREHVPISGVPAFGDVPINGFLGMELESRTVGSATVRLPLRPEFVQEGKLIHGGLVSTLADTASAYAAVGGIDRDSAIVGIEFKMNFLKAAVPAGPPLTAVAHVIRQGKQVIVVRVKVTQEDRDIAVGTFTHLVRRPV